jgi:hypothetical protein
MRPLWDAPPRRPCFTYGVSRKRLRLRPGRLVPARHQANGRPGARTPCPPPCRTLTGARLAGSRRPPASPPVPPPPAASRAAAVAAPGPRKPRPAKRPSVAGRAEDRGAGNLRAGPWSDARAPPSADLDRHPRHRVQRFDPASGGRGHRLPLASGAYRARRRGSGTEHQGEGRLFGRPGARHPSAPFLDVVCSAPW